MICELETRRLILRPLRLEDAATTQRLFPHWEIVRYLASAVPWPFPPDGAATYYREVALPAMEREEAWHWTLRLKDDPDQIIGAISLLRGEKVNRGFWLASPWQRQGLMTEAVTAGTAYWFEVLGFPILRTSKAVANTASRRISEKQGMRLVGAEEQDFVSGRLASETWEITAAEWKNNRRV
jgi:[ribosomal protein S5]-alanine N-acetyltransferase